MKKIVGLFLLLCVFVCQLSAQSVDTSDLLRQIRVNYIHSLVGQDSERMHYLKLLSQVPEEEEISDQNIVELYQRFPVGSEEAGQLIRSLKPDGSWPDINYEDKKRSGWEPKKHAERILKLTKYFYMQQAQASDELKETIHRAMNFWFNRQFFCLNWWYNQIGIPRTLGPAFLMFESEMTAREKELSVREMLYSKFGMTGQNKVWLAGNVLIRGLLQNDFQLVKSARDTIVSEIVLGKREGIKKDWSFHQHGPQQQFGNYGLSFLGNMCMYVEVFSRTPLALSEEQLNILFSFFREGYRWIVWKGFWDVNALDRQLFHNADIHKSYTLLFAAYALMQGCPQEQAHEIRQFIRENFTDSHGKTDWVGNKVFWESDQTVHRTPFWMASVKMASRRVIGTELVNEDNKRGFYMADGALYTYVKGDEYHNIFPFWDWRKIPGITCIESDAPVPVRYDATARNQSDFVGGVTDGQTGITAMELRRQGVTANKCWIFTDHFILCLGSGIKAGNYPATTAVEQVVKKGKLQMAVDNKSWQATGEAGVNIKEKLRFFHGNTGYIVVKGDSCVAEVKRKEGQWFDVMGMYTPRILQQEVVSVYIKHPSGKMAGYEYVVLPATTSREVLKFDTGQYSVLSNEEAVQAVCWGKNCYVAAYQPCRLCLPGKVQLQILTPGIYFLKKAGKRTILRATDPSRKNKVLEFIFNHQVFRMELNEDGFGEQYL